LSVIDDLYHQACGIIRASGTLEGWVARTGLAKNTIQKIRSGDLTHQANSKLRLIDAVLIDRTGLQYSLLADEMGMREDEHLSLRQYCGEFTYVRRALNGGLTSGKVMIRDKLKHVWFEHIPEFDEDFNENTEQRTIHTGFVFLLGKRLVFWGLGNRYSRMMIAMDYDNPRDSVLDGIVLTPDTDRKQPMASMFFMAHESYRSYRSFESEYRKTYNEKLEKRGAGEILGLLSL